METTQQVMMPVNKGEQHGKGDLHEECKQFLGAELGEMNGRGSS